MPVRGSDHQFGVTTALELSETRTLFATSRWVRPSWAARDRSTLTRRDGVLTTWCRWTSTAPGMRAIRAATSRAISWVADWLYPRSEEHTSELQSRLHLVCRLL